MNHLKVLFGKGLLNTEIQADSMDLLVGNVPSKWSVEWEGPSNPVTWLKGFSKRAINFKKWIENTHHGTLLEQDLNLGDLLHPNVFLNALRQKTARKLSVPIDDMKLVSSFENGKIKSPFIIQAILFYSDVIGINR